MNNQPEQNKGISAEEIKNMHYPLPDYIDIVTTTEENIVEREREAFWNGVEVGKNIQLSQPSTPSLSSTTEVQQSDAVEFAEWKECIVGIEIPKHKVLCLNRHGEMFYGILLIQGVLFDFECETDMTIGVDITHYREINLPAPPKK